MDFDMGMDTTCKVMMALALGGLAVSGLCFLAAFAAPYVKAAWDRASKFARAVFCGAAVGAVLFGGAKNGATGKITYPKTDNEIAYLTDAGSYVTNDAVHVAFTRSPVVPDSATFYLDYCALDGTNAQGVATNWVNAKTATFGELEVPFDFAFENATNYNWLAYTDWTPGPAVQTNGVWHAYWGVDKKQGRYFIPVRTCVRDGGEVIATPKSKAEAFYADCVAWVADDAAAGLADGATVSTWTSNDGRTAKTYCGSQTIALNAINGHSAVDFDGRGKFRIDSSQNPIVGQNNFAVAAVVIARSANTTSSYWYSSNGIFGYDIGNTANDWNLGVTVGGHFQHGWGSRSGDWGDYDIVSTTDDADGLVHVVMATMTDESVVTLVVDGKTYSTTKRPIPVRDSSYIEIGGIYNTYLDGQIAEIRVYRDCNLTDAQRNLIGSKLATKYGATWKTE